MTLKGIDAWGAGPSAASAAAAGVHIRFWYSSPDASKDAQAGSVASYAAQGIWSAVNYENGVNDAYGGSAAGRAAASHAVEEYVPQGMPKGASVILSGDEDIPAADFPKVLPYWQGARAYLHANGYLTGAYGEQALIAYLLANGAVDFGGWRSASASFPGGTSTVDVAVVQAVATESIGGVDCDVDTVLVPFIGQWMPGVLAPTAGQPAASPQESDLPYLIGVTPDPTLPAGNTSQGVFLVDAGFLTHVDAASDTGLVAKFGAPVVVSPPFYQSLIENSPVQAATLSAVFVGAVQQLLQNAIVANVTTGVEQGVTDGLTAVFSKLG